MSRRTSKSGRQRAIAPPAIPRHAPSDVERTTAADLPRIHHRAGTLAEVAAIAPTHPLDAIAARWQNLPATATQIPTNAPTGAAKD